MSIKREIVKGLSFIDDTVRDITRKTMSQGSVKNFEIFLTTPIENYCLIDIADFQLQRHMLMNLMQKDNLIYLMGNSVSGISNKVSDETYDYKYSYTQDNNYLENFQRYDAKETTTRSGWRNDNIQKYVNHNQIYGETINVYPDDDDTGTDKFTESEKWDSYMPNKNPNSILNKTKDFFRCRKINTIISRFHTDAEKLDLYDNNESSTSAYGLSHGRNLLTYDAERNGRSYNRNGYDDPYCRVWTHHHQYSQHIHRLIRPFTVEGEGGETTITNEKLHKWGDLFKEMNDGNPAKRVTKNDETITDTSLQPVIQEQLDKDSDVVYERPKWGWKSEKQNGWAMSVLDNETGLVNIAPKYLGGADKNVHPKDCMFSIENLAWQGYDPYSFERALSWEQRGPFGGRIMWFPPYGLRFNEDTSVQWNEHSFIGRGENVYTYTNTSRSGTLEFMMVVDHPSILDYATWYGKSQPDQLPKDTDVLRFFAGCDSGNSKDGSSLLSYVKPTPLTDEYLQKDVSPGPIPIEPDEPEKPTPPEPEVESPDEPIELSFYVFYPNNYSGAFDRESKVEPIAYLLCGNGAQWKCNTSNAKSSEVLPISFKNLSTTNEQFLGTGYEMENSRSNIGQQTKDKNYIIGTGPGYGKNSYIQNNNKKWYYRIDGEYVNGITFNEIKNCFGQTLTKPTSYQDTNSQGLNWKIETVKKYMKETNNDNLYSLAEVACALTSDVNANVIKRNASSLSEERINKLKEYFNKEGDYKVIEIKGVGYSNSHNSRTNKVIYDYGEGPVLTPLRDARNDFLAKERCTTAIEWFISLYGYVKRSEEKNEKNKDVGGEDENGPNAKMWRSAKITLKIKKNKLKKQEELNTKNDGTTISLEDYEKLSDEDKKKYKQYYYFYPYAYITKGRLKDYITVEEYNALSSEDKNKYSVSSYKLNTDEKSEVENGKFQKFKGFKEEGKGPVNGKEVPLYINLNENREKFKNKKWYYDEEEKQMKFYDKVYEKTRRSSYGNNFKQKEENNTLRYDQEYHFFKKLSERNPDAFSSLVDKLQYFDPAFHSMTPEGFMGRLNFLHQCTRQGDTRSVSDENGYTANNLAFGRPPFCVLRLGDFYYQKIVIRNINISYDPLVLDLNQEGVGVVPLIANVTISFNFIGGGDLSGPVRRLQNAMSENYYANGRLYNNRADRIERNIEWDTMKKSIDWDESYHHHVEMSK